MNRKDLIFELNSIKNAKRSYRDKSAKFVLINPETFPFLVEIVFDQNSKLSVKASWILELVCFKNLDLIIPELNFFTQNLKQVSNESSLRPLSKVCMFITKEYYSLSENKIKHHLTSTNKDQIIEAGFDWLIEDHKIATQVYAMDTLFLSGQEYKWIHPELELVLRKNIAQGSPGYQAHARNILKKI